MSYNRQDSIPVVLEAGNYDATIFMANIKSSAKKGTQWLNIGYRVEGQTIYEKVFRDKLYPEDFNHKTIGELLEVCDIDGDIEGDVNIINALLNKELIVSVTKKYDDYYKREINEVSVHLAKGSVETIKLENNDTKADEVDTSGLPF